MGALHPPPDTADAPHGDGGCGAPTLHLYERTLVWVDGRFDRVVAGGQYALWTAFHQVRTETVDARAVRFDHPDLAAILKSPGADKFLEEITIEEGHVGVFFRNGAYVETLPAGRYAMWKGVQKAKVVQVNMRELALDVSGQEIMTADKVTLRLNVVVTYRVADALAAVDKTEDARQALYRDAQLAVRAVVGTRELDAILAEKDAVAGRRGDRRRSAGRRGDRGSAWR